MKHQPLHPSGPTFSRIIAGAWRWHTISHDGLERLIQTSLDRGITTFDHADIYGDHGNERLFGDVLRRNPSLKKSMQFISKCGIKFPSAHRPATWVKHYDTSKEHILWSVENSLTQLNTDHLDLLLIHRPDPLMSPVEIAEAFSELKHAGKVLHFGVSNFTPDQFDNLKSYLSFPLVSNQIEISLFLPQPLFDGSLDNLMKHRASAIAWSPLGGGKFFTGENEIGSRVLNGLNLLAYKYQATPSQLLIAWLLRHPSQIFPVIGTTKTERVEESIKALEITIDRQDWFEMLKWVTGVDVP
jgi:predicted oxidoreductase